MVRCPVCGTRLSLAELITLTERQRLVRDAVETLRRDLGRSPTSVEVAVAVHYSERWTRNVLRELEQLDVLTRPNGPRSGYALKIDHVGLTIAA